MSRHFAPVFVVLALLVFISLVSHGQENPGGAAVPPGPVVTVDKVQHPVQVQNAPNDAIKVKPVRKAFNQTVQISAAEKPIEVPEQHRLVIETVTFETAESGAVSTLQLVISSGTEIATIHLPKSERATVPLRVTIDDAHGKVKLVRDAVTPRMSVTICGFLEPN